MRAREKARVLRLFRQGMCINSIVSVLYPTFRIECRYIDRIDVERVIRDELRKQAGR